MRAGILVLTALAAMPVAARLRAAQEAPSPAARWFGTWSLVSEVPPDPSDPNAYRRVTVTIEPSVEPTDDVVTVAYDMVGMRGGRTHVEWSGAFDGRDYPVQGVDYVLTNAYRQIDAFSYEIVVKVDGAVSATTEVVVSGDGTTMTAATTSPGANGPDATTAVYRRRD